MHAIQDAPSVPATSNRHLAGLTATARGADYQRFRLTGHPLKDQALTDMRARAGEMELFAGNAHGPASDAARLTAEIVVTWA